MNDEQKSQLEEIQKIEREEINRLIEEGATEDLIEKVRFYAEIIEVMARALVNKSNE